MTMPIRSGSLRRAGRWCLALTLLAAALAPAAVAGGPAPRAPEGAAIDRFITAQMDRHRIPGLALAIVEDGAVTYAAGYGTAGGGRPMTPDTPMSLGSVTKAFTAVAVLQLVERGLVALDAPVQEYLPWFRVADADAAREITVRHLLHHTSGLSELGYGRVPAPGVTLEEGVRALASARLTAPVGTTFQYFNPNYATLALIIEVAGGQPYGEYVAEHIFAPLEMTRSFTHPEGALAAGMARGHSKLFGYPVERGLPYRAAVQGAGYLVSTANDLARFLLALAHDGAYGGATILSPASVALMRTAPAGVPGTGYGMGWMGYGCAGVRCEGHGGADEAFLASLTYLPAQGRGYIWLANQQHLLDPSPAALDAGLTALLLGREPQVAGMSMRVLGWGILAGFLVALGFTVRSILALRGWTARSRGLSTGALARDLAPRFLVPVAIIVLMYRVMGPLVFGRAFNLSFVGAYLLPDVTLLILLTASDFLQGLYMAGAVAVDRLRGAMAEGRPRPLAGAARPQGLP